MEVDPATIPEASNAGGSAEDLKLRVAVRVRPMLPIETDKNCIECVKTTDTQVIIKFLTTLFEIGP